MYAEINTCKNMNFEELKFTELLKSHSLLSINNINKANEKVTSISYKIHM